MRPKYLFSVLALITLTVWGAVLAYPDKKLHLIACDVGQGDAILAVYGSLQVLTDGGPGNKVLECLSKYMPFWDREVELVILTHPQTDHFTGLIEVFRRYKVDTFLVSEVDSSARSYEVLEKAVGSSPTKVVHPKEGMVIRLGLIQIDILHPSESFLEQKSSDLNDYSTIYELEFGDFEALFTGDISPKIIGELLAKNLIGPVDYIKIPHHGSRNGTTFGLLEASVPKLAAISVGKDNSYGHPHPEVLKMLNDLGIQTIRTDKVGDIEIETDGRGFKLLSPLVQD